MFLLLADSEDSDQTGRMPRLIWVFAGRKVNFIGFCHAVAHMAFYSRATDFNPTNPSKKLKLDVPGFGDASPYMKAAKLEMERASREVKLRN